MIKEIFNKKRNITLKATLIFIGIKHLLKLDAIKNKETKIWLEV